MKPEAMCVCRELVRVRNRTGIFIVQHMRERTHALGTARLAALGLENVSLETIFSTEDRFESHGVFPADTALLYPGPEARPLEHPAPSKRPRHLVIIDGTWPQASRIYRDSPNLQALPCVTFAEVKPSNYRIRLEPNAAANATIEAVCRALAILEPETSGIDGLLTRFNEMIDAQLRYVETGNPRSKQRIRTFKRTDVPRRLQDEDASLVVACGERLPRETPLKRGVLWTWNAYRLRDGALFSERLSPLPPLSAAEQSSEQAGAGGLSTEAFRTAWHQFLRPEDVLVTWDNKSMGRLFDAVGAHPHFVFLKAAVGNLHRGTPKSLSALIEKERLQVPSLNLAKVESNVAKTLSEMISVVDFLRTKALRSS